jgi:hypothetical protein
VPCMKGGEFEVGWEGDGGVTREGVGGGEPVGVFCEVVGGEEGGGGDRFVRHEVES